MCGRQFGRVCMAAAVALVAGVGTGARAREPVFANTGRLKVTVEYKGQLGTVDKNRKIWIWLFDTPHITTDATPLATGCLTENSRATRSPRCRKPCTSRPVSTHGVGTTARCRRP
jgi:hypothetical protein